MSNLDVERRLTEVLHRRAEVVMSRTDTQTELREFLTRGDQEPPRTLGGNRFTAVVAAGVASAAAAAAVFWAAGLSADRPDPAPVEEPPPSAVEVAEKFVTAYATNDVETVAALAPPDGDQVQDWRTFMARDAAWGVKFMFEPCRRATDADIGTGVVCPFALHVLGSEEVGRGPFENATFTVWVNEAGQVFDADPTWNYEYNGMWKHVEEATGWVWAEHPEQAEFLQLDEPNVPPAQYDRWLNLWREYVADYVEAHTSD